MANIPPPKKVAIVEDLKPKAATEQTPPDSIAPLQVKIPEHVKNEFKAFAAMRGKSMNTLFVEMFEEYKQKHV